MMNRHSYYCPKSVDETVSDLRRQIALAYDLVDDRDIMLTQMRAEIEHLRAERDALKNGSLWLEASAANTALRGKIENLRAEREELLSLLTAARDDVADALYIMASDASTGVLVEQRALLERIDAAMAAEREW